MSRKKIIETTGKIVRTLLDTKIMVSVILLAILTMASLSYIPVQAPTPTSLTYGTATVDGDPSEWDLTNDFFAVMYEAGDPTKDILSKLYLRYDCDADLLYVLVLAEPDCAVQVSTSEAWLRTNCDARDPTETPTAFSWIPPSATETAQGWEASYSLAEGCHTIVVHVNVDCPLGRCDWRTSKTLCLDLFICCGGTTTTVTTTDTDCTTTVDTVTVTDVSTFTDCTEIIATETVTDCTTTIGTTTITDTVTDTLTDCTTTVDTVTVTDVSTFTDCTETIATVTTTTIITTTEDCYLGDGGVSNFGTIQCEGPNVIVGATELPEIWRGAAGTFAADWIDATSAALLWGLCVDGTLYWDHDSTEVNQGTGQTILPGHEIMSGGPLVNAPVKYYEGAKLAPVYYKPVGSKATFFDSTTDTQIVGAELLGSEIGVSKDMFVIMIVQKPGTEADPEYAVMAYGFAGRGTLASSVYFKTVIEPDLSSYTRDYYIVQWDDTNANGHPDIPGTDTYTPISPSP
jgi:hypothetical protein